MGGQESKGAQQIEEEGSKLFQEFEGLKTKKNRPLSKDDFRKSIKAKRSSHNIGSTDEDKIKEMFADKSVIEFTDFLKWKMATVSTFVFKVLALQQPSLVDK